MSDQRADPRPSWKALLAQHGLTVEQVARKVQSLSTLCYQEALEMAREARGTPERIDIALLALSRLAKVAYSRRNVGGFTFIASEGDSQVQLNLPADTLEHYLNRLRAHGAVIQDTVYPPSPSLASRAPAPYLIVSLPVGTLLAFEEPGASQALTADDLTAYFPDGYVLHTRLTLVWGIAYHVVLSQQEGAAGS